MPNLFNNYSLACTMPDISWVMGEVLGNIGCLLRNTMKT